MTVELIDEVLLVTEAGYPTGVGGVSTWVHDLTAGLPERRFTVLALGFDEPDGPAPLLPQNTRLVELRFTPPVTIAAAIQRALDAVRDCRAAVVHASSTGIAGLAALEYSRRTGAPLLVTEHGIAWRDLRREQGEPGLLRRADIHASIHTFNAQGTRIAREIYAHAAAISSVSHANVALQRRLAPSAAVEVIPNGVAASVEPQQRRSALRTIVFAGRVAPEKGVDRFVQTAGLLARRYSGLTFEVRGPLDDVDYAQRCRMLAAAAGIEERLRFTGPVPRAALIDGADLLLLPSRLEACPYVQIEAMAAGVPVVVADAGDCAWIAGRGGLAARGDEAVFAQAVEILLEPRAYRAAAGNARRRAMERFSRTEMLNRYRAVYARVERRRGLVAAA